MSAKVAWISIAPVKALGLVHLEEALVERVGIRENRRFHLVDHTGRMINGKVLGALVQVAPAWDEASGTLALRLPDGSVVDGVVELAEPFTTVFYGRPVPGRIVEGPWAEALSRFVSRPLRLVRTDDAGEAVDRAAGVP